MGLRKRLLIVQHLCDADFNAATHMIKSGSPSSKIFSARWVVPVSSLPIPLGAVVVEGATIVAVGDRQTLVGDYPHAQVFDYGEAIITPGLINLHTHLDYTLLRHIDTESGMFGWIRSLVSGSRQFNADDWLHSALQGAAETALSGTTCVADSSYQGAAAEAACLVGLKAVVALELFGLDASRAPEIWQEWQHKLADLQQRLGQTARAAGIDLSDGRIVLTVSPHAPYTVAPALWRLASEWATARGLPVLCHLAESQAECDFFAGDGADIIGYLSWVYRQEPDQVEEWTAWRQLQGKCSPVQFAHRHQLLGPHTVAAHAIQLNDDDLRVLKESGVGIAHCPRSNARLRNGFAPVNRYLSEGLQFGFGTDSAASSPDLSVLSEARFSLHALRLVDAEYKVASEVFFHHLTLGAAQVLGIDSATGSLETGKSADIVVFDIDQLITGKALDRPFEMLMHGGVSVRDVFVNGEAIVCNRSLQRRLPVKVSETPVVASSSW